MDNASISTKETTTTLDTLKPTDTTIDLDAPGSSTSADPSYIDFEVFLSPTFDPYSFANTLIQATNDPSDTTLDLSTPLSRVLFDLQEIDSHIHNLTTQSAIPLLTYTSSVTASSSELIATLKEQLTHLNESYARLKKEISDRYAIAAPLQEGCVNLEATTRLLRNIVRCLLLARQLEIQMAESTDIKALVRAAHTVVEFRRLISQDLEAVDVVKTLITTLVTPAEKQIRIKAQQVVKEFSVKLIEEGGGRARAGAGVLALHILSGGMLTTTVQTYLQNQLTTSLAGLSRSLTMLSTLERTLSEVSVRAANIVALEKLLGSIKDTTSPAAVAAIEANNVSKIGNTDAVGSDDGLEGESEDEDDVSNQFTLLTPLLTTLDTSSLTTHFFRTLASNLDPRVREIISRGGASAKSLRENRDRIRSGLRECVLSGVREGSGEKTGTVKGMEGLVGMMVGAVGALGR